LSHERGGELSVVPSYGFASQLSYYRPSCSDRQPSSSDTESSSKVDSDSGRTTPVPDKYSIAP